MHVLYWNFCTIMRLQATWCVQLPAAHSYKNLRYCFHVYKLAFDLHLRAHTRHTSSSAHRPLFIRLQNKANPWVCLSVYTCTCGASLGAGNCVALARSLSCTSVLDCLPLRWRRLLLKSSGRGCANWENKTTSIHTSCCTLEPKLPATDPENPLSSQCGT